MTIMNEYFEFNILIIIKMIFSDKKLITILSREKTFIILDKLILILKKMKILLLHFKFIIYSYF